MGSGSKGIGSIVGGGIGYAFGGAPGMSAGMAIGGGLEGALSPQESYNGPTLQKLDKNLIDNMAAEAAGERVTASELQLKANMDKSLAAQLALIKSNKARNPALQSRQIAKAAAENAARASQDAAIVNAQERKNAYEKYVRALEYNNAVDQKNYGMAQAFKQQQDTKQGNAWNAIAQGAMLGAQAYGAQQKLDAQKPVPNEPLAQVQAPGANFGSQSLPQSLNDFNSPYTFGLS